LIETAIRSGAHFLDSTQGILDSNSSSCRLDLKRRSEEGKVGCRIAVLATGLVGKQKDAEDALEWKSPSYIGAGAILEEGAAGFEPGTVSMACHPSGYVGIVQLEDGRLDLAAAFDIEFVKRLGGLSNAACRVISESGLRMPRRMNGAQWQGTVKLTHQRAKLFGARYLVAGDAAGYVEPFTGEGIAWAMASGQAVSSFACRALSRSMSVVGPAWSQEYRRILGRRMRSCKAISFLLRQPAFLRLAVRVLQMSPRLAGPIERSLSKPFALSN
jgi:flavin-dependent dehydrogenase